jgi:hypothetical protein
VDAHDGGEVIFGAPPDAGVAQCRSVQILRELRPEFSYVLILLALVEKCEPNQHNDAPRGCPPMFLRKSMILIRLLRIFVQEFDSKKVAICAWEVAGSAARGRADTGDVIR